MTPADAPKLSCSALRRNSSPRSLKQANGQWLNVFNLNVTARIMQSLMEDAIAQARRDNQVGTGPFSVGAKGRLLIWIAEPPPKFRIPAPPHLRPPARIDNPLELLPDFLKAQDEWERMIRESAGLDQGRKTFFAFSRPICRRIALDDGPPASTFIAGRKRKAADCFCRSQKLCTGGLSRAGNCLVPKTVFGILIWLRRIGNARSKAGSIDMHAGAGTAARLGGAAASAANANQARALVQLPR